MHKLIIVLCLLLQVLSLSAKCSEVPPYIKDSYASNMHHAFWLQAHGKSTLAYRNGETLQSKLRRCVNLCLGLVKSFRVFYDGLTRLYSSLNNIWAGHQGMISLKQWEQGPLKAAQQQ